MNSNAATPHLGDQAPYRFVGEAGAAQHAGDADALARALHDDYDAQHAAIRRAWDQLPTVPPQRGGVIDVAAHAELGGRRDALAAAETFMRACVRNADEPTIDESITAGVIAPDGSLSSLRTSPQIKEPAPAPMPGWAAQIKESTR